MTEKRGVTGEWLGVTGERRKKVIKDLLLIKHFRSRAFTSIFKQNTVKCEMIVFE